MKIKKCEKAKNNTQANFSLDLNSELPFIEMIGNRRITIEGSTGVLHYESENIKINTSKMVLSFSGRNLTVKCISCSDVIIEGFITSLEFIT